MKRIREILRYKFEHNLSNERIALPLIVSKGTVHNILKRFSISELSWPLKEDISDTQLEQSLYGPQIDHKGGDLLYVDYSGDGLKYVNRDTGECVTVSLFVCAWGHDPCNINNTGSSSQNSTIKYSIRQ